jgi:hypothetical protein
MFGFMAEKLHTKVRSQAAANGRNGHKNPLRGSPGTFFGFLLIRKHTHEACGIDYNEVQV